MRLGGSRATVGAAVTVVLCALSAVLALLAGCGGQRPPAAAPLPEGPAQGLDRLVRLATERVMLSDQVAASKAGTGKPVTDPPREAAVLAEARADAGRAGVDPEWAARVFSDQIAASTRVQNDLLKQWTDRPDTRPAQRPDLAGIRPELDRIGDGLIGALAQAAPVRAHQGCPARLARDVDAERSLDGTHRSALERALTSVCG